MARLTARSYSLTESATDREDDDDDDNDDAAVMSTMTTKTAATSVMDRRLVFVKFDTTFVIMDDGFQRPAKF